MTILEPNKTEALTYTIFRDSEKNLYIAVYWEDLVQKDLLPYPYNLHNFLMLGTEQILFTTIGDEGKIEISLEEESVKELIYGIH